MLNKDSIKTLIASSLYGFYDEILKNDFATKDDVNNAQYYEYPTIHYDDNYTKGYVDVTELKPDIIYKMPKYPEVESGSFSQICICCKNDDDTIVRINNKANTLGFSHKADASIFLLIKIDSQIMMQYKSNNDYYIINLKKTDGIWSVYQLQALKPGSDEEYIPTKDYHPATKKYVDDTADTLVQKDTNKYILICNDDTLVINKTDITDLTDATIAIDNLTGQFGTLVANDDGTYSYTLNTIMTDVETFTFKVNDVEQKLVIVPYKEMIYDDKNAGITYSENWSIEENNKYYNGSSHISTTNGEECNINFKGTGVAILSKCDSDASSLLFELKGKKNMFEKIIVNSDEEIYQANIYSKKNGIYSDYSLKITLLSIDSIGKCKAYIDSIIIYDTLGTDLNDSIRKLYYGKDNSIGVLRTDTENPKFDPTKLYDPTTKKYVDDANAEATDEEIDAMLLEVLGGDYSVQS